MNIIFTFLTAIACGISGYVMGQNSNAGKRLGDAFMNEIDASKVALWCEDQFETRAEKHAVYTFCKHLLDEVKNRLVE